MFEGIITAIITPFKSNKQIDYECFIQLIKEQIEAGVNGIVIAGTTGEGATLTDEEIYNLAQIAVNHVEKRIKIIVNCGSNSTQKSLNLINLVKDLAIDGIMVITPYYNKTSTVGLHRHFKTIIDSTRLPIILYNVPSRTNINIPIEVLIKLEKTTNNHLFIKDASGNSNYWGEILSKTKITLLAGNDSDLLPVLICGGKGLISVASNLIPADLVLIYDLFKKRKIKSAKEKMLKIAPIISSLFIDVNPIPIKEALYLKNKIKIQYRLPLVRLDSKKRRQIRKIIQESL